MSWLLLWVAAWAGPRDWVPLPEADAAFSRGLPGAVDDRPWWAGFGDPGLGRVIEEGLAVNPDLASADARVAQAAALTWQSRSPLVPQVSVDLQGSGAPLRTLGFQFGGLPGLDPDSNALYYLGSADLTAAWQLDLFGRTWLAWRATVNERQAGEADREALVLALSTSLGGAYLDVVAAREQERVTTEQLALSRALLELTQMRYERGGQGGLDVLQQQQTVAQVEALAATARMGREVAEAQLRVLLARDPGAALPEVGAALPNLPPTPPVGTPAELVDRRPDLRAASTRLDAAGQRRLSETMALLPTFRAQFSTGRDWIDLDEVRHQDAWQVGGAVSVPVFNGGRQQGAIRAARAGEHAAAAAFGKAMIQAVGEVEVALAQEEALAARLVAVEAQAEAARAAFDEARGRYLDGVDPFVNVLLTQNTLRSAELSRVGARRDVLGARLRLHAALGGTWTAAYGFDRDGEPR